MTKNFKRPVVTAEQLKPVTDQQIRTTPPAAPAEDAETIKTLTLRLPASTLDAIEAARRVRPGRPSKNTWIAEAIAEKLAKEANIAS